MANAGRKGSEGWGNLPGREHPNGSQKMNGSLRALWGIEKKVSLSSVQQRKPRFRESSSLTEVTKGELLYVTVPSEPGILPPPTPLSWHLR